MSLREKLINIIYSVATGNKRIKIVLTPILPTFLFTLIVLFIIISLRIDKFLKLPKLLPASSSMLISVPILAIGLFLILWSNLHFIKAKGTPVPINPPPKLVITGPYAYVRNPMVTGVFILLFGLGILLNSTSLVFIFMPIFILFAVLELKTIEEPELEKRLGKEYTEYKKKVPIFIPWLKGKKLKQDYMSKSGILISLTFFLLLGVGVFASDEIEDNLSKNIANFAEIKLKEDLSQKDKAYLYFLLALHKRDSQTRDIAEEMFKRLNTSESQAYIGSIQTLKARDFLGGGILQGISNLTPLGYIRLNYVKSGIKQIDKAVKENPNNFEIRFVRANTYLEIPSIFKKFEMGLEDIELILKWLENGVVDVLDEDPFFRDKSAIYYIAGKYYLKAGKVNKTKELFLKATKLSPHSPYTVAAKKRLQWLKSLSPLFPGQSSGH